MMTTRTASTLMRKSLTKTRGSVEIQQLMVWANWEEVLALQSKLIGY